MHAVRSNRSNPVTRTVQPVTTGHAPRFSCARQHSFAHLDINNLYEPSLSQRQFAHVPDARLKVDTTHSAKNNFVRENYERLLNRYDGAVSKWEKEDAGRVASRMVESDLSKIFLSTPDEDLNQEKVGARIMEHFGSLDSDMMSRLVEALKHGRFGVKLVHSVIDDEMLRDHGFTNGPPHRSSTTIMATEEIYMLFDEIRRREIRRRQVEL